MKKRNSRYHFLVAEVSKPLLAKTRVAFAATTCVCVLPHAFQGKIRNYRKDGGGVVFRTTHTSLLKSSRASTFPCKQPPRLSLINPFRVYDELTFFGVPLKRRCRGLDLLPVSLLTVPLGDLI